MKVSIQNVENNEEYSLDLNEEEVKYFIEYAVVDLLRKGLLHIEDESPLESIPAEEMPRA